MFSTLRNASEKIEICDYESKSVNYSEINFYIVYFFLLCLKKHEQRRATSPISLSERLLLLKINGSNLIFLSKRFFSYFNIEIFHRFNKNSNIVLPFSRHTSLYVT